MASVKKNKDGSWSYSWDYAGKSGSCMFSRGWKQFRSCAAAYYHRMHMDTCTKNHMRDTVTHNYWSLISYSTPILEVSSHHSDLLENTNWIVILNEDYWRHSTTTIQHVNKFLAYVGVPISYLDLKEFMNSPKMHFFVDNYCRGVHVYRQTNGAMQQMFASKVPPFGRI